VRDLAGAPARIDWDPEAVRFEAGSGGGRAVALGGRGDAVAISRANGEIFGLDAFSIELDLQRAGTGKDGGHVLHLHRTLDLVLSDDGRLSFGLATDEGRATVRSEAGAVGKGWHAVELRYASGDGIALRLDGAEVARAALSGTTAEALHWDLVLGRPWGGEARGRVDDFVFRAGPEDRALLALDFEGDLRDAGGRDVGVRAQGALRFREGSDGQGAALGEGSVLVGRENAFLHERDAFEMTFDVRRDGPAESGRLLHLNNAMDAWVSADGRLSFGLTTDEGVFWVDSKPGAVSGRGWHEVEIGYDAASQRLRLEVDGRASEARAWGETAEAKWWGLTLGAAWGDPLEATIDAFRFNDAPDWA
jgi:hypothetical protein